MSSLIEKNKQTDGVVGDHYSFVFDGHPSNLGSRAANTQAWSVGSFTFLEDWSLSGAKKTQWGEEGCKG